MRALFTAEQRRKEALQMQRDYYAGASIRSLAKKEGVSYGTARAMLVEAGTTLRNRGGGARRKPPASSS